MQAIRDIRRQIAPTTLNEVLDAVIAANASPNGVAQLKCDLPQILPFLLDRRCAARLRGAEFVYLTRDDRLDQAISRYKSSSSGYHHSYQGAPPSPDTIAYDFNGIREHLETLTRMAAAYERIFALMGIAPLRISYEQLVASDGDDIRRIAGLVGVALPGDVTLSTGRLTRLADARSAMFKTRFLKDVRQRNAASDNGDTTPPD